MYQISFVPLDRLEDFLNCKVTDEQWHNCKPELVKIFYVQEKQKYCVISKDK